MSWTGSTFNSVATIQAFGGYLRNPPIGRIERLEAAIHTSGRVNADSSPAPLPGGAIAGASIGQANGQHKEEMSTTRPERAWSGVYSDCFPLCAPSNEYFTRLCVYGHQRDTDLDCGQTQAR